MDTINTIITNYHALSNAPIDWSPMGGMIWLTGTMVIMALCFGACILSEILADYREEQREEAFEKKLLYMEAQYWGKLRIEQLSKHGYIEYRRSA